MTPKEILNKIVYPRSGDNARRKTFPLHDTIQMATGTLEYHFFETAITNRYDQNKRFPLASTEIFMITALSAYIEAEKDTVAEIDALNALLQQSYLEIWCNSRRICKLPALDFVNYCYTQSIAATATAMLEPKIGGNLNRDGFLGRKFSVPIPFVGNSAFKFRFVTTAAVATSFNGINLRLSLYGIQTDKLADFPYDSLKDYEFQEIPVTLYETRAITTTDEVTYQLFEQNAIADTLQSGYFPLSDIEIFQLEAIEVFVNQPDTPIDPVTIYNSSIQKRLVIRSDEIDYWDAVLGNQLLSMIAGFSVAITTTPDADVIEIMHVRKQLVLPVPLTFAANGKASIQLMQPPTSLPITGEFTICLRGTATRRVA